MPEKHSEKIDLMIELTNRCTLRCPTCFSHQDGRSKSSMSFGHFKKIIDDNAHLIGDISLYNYGEPYLNKHLFSMIYYAKKSGIAHIKVATNGMHLTQENIIRTIKSGLDYLSISVDGATQSTYEKFRLGGQFKTVIEGVRGLVRARNTAKSRLKVELQFIIMSHNDHELRLIEILARDLGVDYLRLKSVLIKRARWSYLLPENEAHNRYAQKKSPNNCFKAVDELVVNCDGSVIPCCYIVGEDIKNFTVGNMFKQTLAEILNSHVYRDFIQKCTTDKSQLSTCADCQEGNHSLDYKLINLHQERNTVCPVSHYSAVQ